MPNVLHEEVVYKKGRGSYDDAVSEGEKLIAEGYDPMDEFRVEYNEPTGNWIVYFRMKKDIVDQFRRSRKMATKLAAIATDYEFPGNESWGNLDEDLLAKVFHEKGVHPQTVEYDDPRKEVEVWFGSMLGKGKYPENIKDVMDHVVNRIGAEGWLFRRDDPWVISFSFANDWRRAMLYNDRVVMSKGKPYSRSAPVTSPPGKRTYRRNFDWITMNDFNKGQQETPFWDRQQMPEEAGEGYNMGNRFNDADKVMDGPVAGLHPHDSVVMKQAASRDDPERGKYPDLDMISDALDMVTRRRDAVQSERKDWNDLERFDKKSYELGFNEGANDALKDVQNDLMTLYSSK